MTRRRKLAVPKRVAFYFALNALSSNLGITRGLLCRYFSRFHHRILNDWRCQINAGGFGFARFVIRKASTSRNQSTNNHVFLESAQFIALAQYGGLCKNTRGFLER